MRWYITFSKVFFSVWFVGLAFATIGIMYRLFFAAEVDGSGLFESGLPFREKLNTCFLLLLFWIFGYGVWRRCKSTFPINRGALLVDGNPIPDDAAEAAPIDNHNSV